jgi:PAS domain S-box-containing protein
LTTLTACKPEEIQQVLHELRVHQIELEMQNEELRLAQAEIQAGRDRYFDLYDLAPVGYCTLSGKGLILEANLTLAALLGTARGMLVKQPISRFIFKDDQDTYYLHRKLLLETGEAQICEMRLVRPDGAFFWAHLTGTAAQAEDGTPVYRAAFSDITELYKQAHELAALEERQRLARDLHDAINQSLFAAGIIAEVIPRIWEQDQDLARRSLKDLHRLTRSAQAEMRVLLAELRPSTLIDTDLGDLVKHLGYALAGRVDIPVDVMTSGTLHLPSRVQIVFYRICQEALNNIAKHAKASRVKIEIQQDGPELTLRIHDDGRGFDQNQTTPGHYGLQMMQERADGVGAQLTVISQPGQGTQLTICWEDSAPEEGK